MEIPELGIRNSKLADEVVDAIRDSKNIYEMAHHLVAIADASIHSQTVRDTIDLAIEYARTPGFSLSRRDLQMIKHSLLASQESLSQLKSEVGDDYYINGIKYWVEETLKRIPKTAVEKVHQKLGKGKVDKPAQPFSPYSARLQMPDVFKYAKEIERVVDKRNLRKELDGTLEDLYMRIEEVARTVKFPLARAKRRAGEIERAVEKVYKKLRGVRCPKCGYAPKPGEVLKVWDKVFATAGHQWPRADVCAQISFDERGVLDDPHWGLGDALSFANEETIICPKCDAGRSMREWGLNWK